MSIYKIDQKTKYNKLLSATLPLIPRPAQNYLLSQVTHLEASTRYGYASNYCVFFNFVCGNITRFSHLSAPMLTFDDLKDITYDDINFFKNYYLANHSNSSLNRILCSLSSLYNYYIKQLILDVNPVLPISRSSDTNSSPKLIDSDVSKLLSNALTGDFLKGKSHTHFSRLKLRDYAILRLIIDLGLSVSDICSLNISDVDLNDNSIWLFSTKRGWSVIHFTDELKNILSDYQNYRISITDARSDAFFIQRDTDRLSSRTIELIVKKYCSNISASISPRSLRKYALSNDLAV